MGDNGNTRCCRLFLKTKIILLFLYAKSFCPLKIGDIKKLSLIERGAKIFNGSNFGKNNKKIKKLLSQYQFCVKSADDRPKIMELTFRVFEFFFFEFR